MTIKLWLAVWAGRMAGWVSRLTGRGGSSLPGLVARRLEPATLTQLVRHLSWGAILLTGTNGKTTTAALARQIFEEAHRRVVTNRAGANLIEGLTAALVQAERWRVAPRAALALLETDEATMPRAAREIRPRVVTVTNFFRDQLDRYGELSTTVKYVARGIEELLPEGRLVLNADDPQVAGLRRDGVHTVFYGLELAEPTSEGDAEAGDARFCPYCGTALQYRRRYYAHIGHYACPGCGWERPQPRVRVVDWHPGAGWATVEVDAERVTVPWRLPGIYNLYNLGAGLATVVAAGLTLEAIQAGMERFKPAFGRMENLTVGVARWWLALVKNPTGFNQVLATLAESRLPSFGVVVAINDHYADGRDVSWLWDVDFERWLPRLSAQHWYVTGTRAYDMAVRLKYAGLSLAHITVETHLEAMLERLKRQERFETLYVLPTYTALLAIRRQLTRWGVTEHFREG
ncbi:MAG: MurT ligase domain-containing protein [Firmicutes bacterium]|nr:MurT ligase domain-containing protein [Bacillota bacterium]